MKVVSAFFIVFMSLGSCYAAGSLPCRDMSDEKLLETLSETEARITCKSSLSIGALCSGIGGASAFSATVLAQSVQEKLANKVIQAELLKIANITTEIEALKYQQQQIVKTGDLSQATNSSGDADIKRKIPELEKKITESFKKLEKLKKTPAQFAQALNAMNKKMIDVEQSKFILRSIQKLRDIAEYNGREAREIHLLAQKLFNPLQEALSEAGKVSGAARGATVAGGVALRTSTQIGKKILGSRFLAFLGGATFSGLTLGLYTSSIACESDTSLQYITYDDECKPQIEISENVINFLTASVPDQLSALRKDARVCDFYLTLAQKLRLDDKPAEAVLSKISNLSCGQNVSFQIDDGKKVSSYQISAKGGQAQSLKSENPDWRLGFNSDGAASQYCEGGRDCEAFQSGASRKVGEKVITLISQLRLASSEAVACCDSSGDLRSTCLSKYASSTQSETTSTGGGSKKSSGVDSAK